MTLIGRRGLRGIWIIFPNGRMAHTQRRAWWRGRLGHKLDGCLDAEGSEEETAAFVHDYTEFLMHSPHGKHEKEARELLKDFRADLESYKQRKSQ